MNGLKGKKILIFQQRGWAINIGHFLAQKLQAEGCELAAITLKRSTHTFIASQKDVDYKRIVSVDDIFDDPSKYLKKEDIPLETICTDLGIDSVWAMMQSNRLFVRTYGDKYYYSFSQNVSDEFIANYIKAYWLVAKDLLEEFKPDLIIAPAAIYEGHLILNLLADKMNIPMVSVADSKVIGYYFFSYNYNNDRGEFFDRINTLNNNLTETSNRQRAKEYIKKFRETFLQTEHAVRWEMNRKKRTFWQKIKVELSPYRTIVGWYFKNKQKENFIKSVGPTIDYRPPRIILRDFYCQRKYTKFARNFHYYPFDKMGRCVYFPLQFQPEATIDLFSPYFNNQLEVARQIAMSLPDDYTLMVKMHPGMVGLISPAFIDKAARTPNVKLIDYRISSEEVIKKADLIISPNSTSLAEAAFFYKPGIQLGNLGTTLKLPNVFKHTNMITLSKKIKELLALNLKNDDYERRLENFVAAVYDTGFEFQYATVWRKGRGDDKNILWAAYKKEIIRILNR